LRYESASDSTCRGFAGGFKTFETGINKKGNYIMSTRQKIEVRTADKAEVLEFPWGVLTWYASGTLGNSQDMTVGKCTLKPGEGNPPHQHPNCSEVLVVMKGKILHTGPDGEMVGMSEGDTVTAPAGCLHQAKNIGDINAELFIAFSSAYRDTQGE